MSNQSESPETKPEVGSDDLLRAVEAAAKEIEWVARVFEGYTNSKLTSIGVDNALARLPEIATELRQALNANCGGTGEAS